MCLRIIKMIYYTHTQSTTSFLYSQGLLLISNYANHRGPFIYRLFSLSNLAIDSVCPVHGNISTGCTAFTS